MAQLALAVVGGVIGTVIAPGIGTAIGFAAGELAGALLFPAKSNTQPTTLANQLNNASYGQPIPLCYGTALVSSDNRIWQEPYLVVKNPESAKGFGGGITEQTVYGSCAWGVCQGPIHGFGRIWANGNLIVTPPGSTTVYNLPGAVHVVSAGTGGTPGPAEVEGTTGNGSPAFILQVTIGAGGGIESINQLVNAGYYPPGGGIEDPSDEPVQDISGSGLTGATVSLTVKPNPTGNFAQFFTYYLGTEDQLPDPTIESKEGVGNVPGYRGLAYIVATGMTLTLFGNGYPSLEVEVTGIVVETGGSCGNALEVLAWGTDKGANITLSNADLTATMSGAGPQTVLTNGTLPACTGYFEITVPTITNYVAIGAYGTIGPFNPPTGDIASVFDNNSFGYEWGTGGLVGRMITPPVGWPTGFAGYEIIDPWEAGDTIGVAFDTRTSTAKWWFRVIHLGVAGSWNASATVGLPSDPAAGTGAFTSGFGAGAWIAASLGGAGDQVVANFGPFFLAAAPTGFGSVFQLTLADLVTDVCQRCGLDPSTDIDVTPLEGLTSPTPTPPTSESVNGVVFAQQMSGAQIIQAAMVDYFFVGAEEDDLIRFHFRGGASIATVTEDDLAAESQAKGGSSTKPKVTETRRDDMDLPQQVYFTYVDPALEYQEGAQVSPQRADAMSSRNLQQVDSVFVHPRTEALQIAAITNDVQWTGRTDLAFSLPPKYRAYSPGDVLTLVYNNGAVTRDVELTSCAAGADLVLEFKGISADAEAFIPGPLLGAGSSNPGQSVPEQETTTLLMLDVPLLTAPDDSMGYYAALHGTDLQWSGGAVVKSSDDVNFAQIGQSAVPAVTGVTTSVLANRLTWGWDRTSTVTVLLDESDESLASVTESDVLNQQNIFMVGSEMIGAATVTLVSGGEYELSDLIRGLQGTDWAVGTHAVGERVVRLARDTSIISITAPLGEFGLLRYFRGVGKGELISAAADVDFTPAGIRIKPLSPFVDPTKATRDGGENLTLPFTPRSRLIAGWYTTAPDESQGIFRADVIFPVSPTTVVRTITSTPSANGSVIDPLRFTVTYKAADQVIDGITPGDPVLLDVYQMSARIGALAGYKTEITA